MYIIYTIYMYTIEVHIYDNSHILLPKRFFGPKSSVKLCYIFLLHPHGHIPEKYNTHTSTITKPIHIHIAI